MSLDQQRKELVHEFVANLQSIGVICVFNAFDDDPDLTLIDVNRGITLVDFFWNYGMDDSQTNLEWAEVNLRKKKRELLARYHSLEGVPIYHGLIKYPSRSALNRLTQILQEHSQVQLDSKKIQEFIQQVKPERILTYRTSVRQLDADFSARETFRFRLDKEQERVALNVSDPVVLLTGPPGSGKTLVLIARARHLAQEHPDWRIQILCFNNVLAIYLRQLVEGFPNIFVETIRSYQAQSSSKHALLIDEFQDFEYRDGLKAITTLMHGFGGIFVCGDVNQALYIANPSADWLMALNPRHLELKVPYRSSKQILQLIGVLDPEFQIDNTEDLPEGPAVQVVRADNQEAATDALVWDVKNLLDKGVAPNQIAVLTLYNAVLFNVLKPRLLSAEIPIRIFRREREEIWDDVMLGSNAVKLSTIHSLKGLEYSYVFFFGLDQLKDPNETDISFEERDTRVKLNRGILVGPSRAKDYVCIYYFKPNYVIRRLVTAKRNGIFDFESFDWPDDYPLEIESS